MTLRFDRPRTLASILQSGASRVKMTTEEHFRPLPGVTLPILKAETGCGFPKALRRADPYENSFDGGYAILMISE
jgi:hypothetical protein